MHCVCHDDRSLILTLVAIDVHANRFVRWLRFGRHCGRRGWCVHRRAISGDSNSSDSPIYSFELERIDGSKDDAGRVQDTT
jgi:hypothetical protein